MALITCSECHAQISDKADACPKCGNPLSTKPARATQRPVSLGRKILRTSAAIVVGIVAISIWASYETSRPPGGSASVASTDESAQEAPAPEPSPAPEPPIKLSALDLYNAYHANEVAADGKYKGHILAVTGNVTTIGKDVFDNPYVALEADNQFDTVNAYFGKDQNDRLSQLKKGDGITVTCRGGGMSIGSPVLRCD